MVKDYIIRESNVVPPPHSTNQTRTFLTPLSIRGSENLETIPNFYLQNESVLTPGMIDIVLVTTADEIQDPPSTHVAKNIDNGPYSKHPRRISSP
jgi:hypothetical protein